MNRVGSGNPLALGLVIVGAVAMALAAFLPLNESTGVFRLVQDNTLIQHGGWLLIAAAVCIAVSGFWVSQSNPDAWVLPVLLCVLAGIGIVIWATDNDLRTLYPVGADGAPDTSQHGVVASLGIALYVAGAGVAVALVGSLMLRLSRPAGGVEPLDGGASVGARTKKCSDCAETVLADAKVCKHCGYRFAPAADGKAQSKPTSPEPQPHPKPRKTPEAKPLTKTIALRLGDRVTLVAPGDKNDGKTGKVIEVLETGYVVVRFGGLRQYLWEYPYRPNQLKQLDSRTN
jgi:hypothetical protein